VVEKEFSGLEEAIRYAFRRQAERRNLTQGEILEAAVRLGLKDYKDGKGRGTERLAKDLGVSESTVTHARTVAKRGTREDLEAIKKGDKTINEVYRDLRKAKEPEKEPDAVHGFTDFEGGGDIDTPPMPVMPEEPEGLIDPLEGGETETTGEDTENAVSETGGLGADGGEEGEEAADEPADWGGGPELPETFAEEGEAEEQGRKDRVPDYGDIGDSLQIKFLRSVVILLCENKQIEGAGLLIRHFVRRKNIPLFTAVLPEKTREILAAYGGPQDGGGE
jgi:hypothetical protein